VKVILHVIAHAAARGIRHELKSKEQR
jgi:hypothetical protein